ncbi:MAG: MTAP family purine nucleoside phosphorylase [Thermodesulfobacteriota bacterium]
MSQTIGLLAGTVFYHQKYFAQAERKTIETDFGQTAVLLTGRWAYVARHGLEGEAYLPPHRINHAANLAALKKVGVKEIIGVNSCGSLRPSLGPGSVVLPNDYIALARVETIFNDHREHIVPMLSERVQKKLSTAAKAAGVYLVKGGIYWQTPGPRLETKAEIRLLAHYADMVGMTMASEATIAQEMGLEYASLCSVDNHAHGLSPIPLTGEEIMANAGANADKIFKIIQAYPEE